MVTMLERRTVSRIDHPVEQVRMNSTHRIRPLLGFGAWKEHDPFLALMEDWFPRGVFDRHPHRGIETVTYVLDGELEHYDNQGNAGVIRPGDAQWMTAGRGVIHNEIPAEGVTVHSLQLWVNLPAAHKLTAPRYQDLTAATRPVRREPGVEVRVFSGASGGVSAATLNYVPVTMVEVRLRRAQRPSKTCLPATTRSSWCSKGRGASAPATTRSTPAMSPSCHAPPSRPR